MSDLQHVTIYTDGACLGNPGPGGYGAVLLFGEQRRELSEGFRRTTNNRMEILAVVAALRALRHPCDASVYSDSQYVVNAMSKGWARRWRASGWMRTPTDPARNADLWEELLALCQTHRVRFCWVRGHAGDRENERCDELSVAAARGPAWSVDEVYERGGR